MDVDLDTLPDDVGALRALLLAERISVALHQAEHAELAAELGAVNLERDRLATETRARAAEIADLEATVARMEAQAARYEHMLAQLRWLNYAGSTSADAQSNWTPINSSLD